jgi:hypothetical protein
MAGCTRYNIMYKVCHWLATGQRYYPGIPVSSTNKTEILLEVVLNTIHHNHQLKSYKPLQYLSLFFTNLSSARINRPQSFLLNNYSRNINFRTNKNKTCQHKINWLFVTSLIHNLETASPKVVSRKRRRKCTLKSYDRFTNS